MATVKGSVMVPLPIRRLGRCARVAAARERPDPAAGREGAAARDPEDDRRDRNPDEPRVTAPEDQRNADADQDERPEAPGLAEHVRVEDPGPGQQRNSHRAARGRAPRTGGLGGCAWSASPLRSRRRRLHTEVRSGDARARPSSELSTFRAPAHGSEVIVRPGRLVRFSQTVADAAPVHPVPGRRAAGATLATARRRADPRVRRASRPRIRAERVVGGKQIEAEWAPTSPPTSRSSTRMLAGRLGGFAPDRGSIGQVVDECQVGRHGVDRIGSPSPSEPPSVRRLIPAVDHPRLADVVLDGREAVASRAGRAG